MLYKKNIFYFLLALIPFCFSNFFSYSDIFYLSLIYLLFIIIPILFIRKNIIEIQASMLDISFWAYVYIFIGLAAFVQVSNNIIPWVDYDHQSHLIFQSIIIFFIGIISFIFGRYSKINLVAPPCQRPGDDRSSIDRLPLKHGPDRRETLPKRVSDNPRQVHFRPKNIFFGEIFRR